MKQSILLTILLLESITYSACTSAPVGEIVPIKTVTQYIDSFNTYDNEIYVQHYPNSAASEFLTKNIPRFECPDKELEQTYYFRWWTFRKHIKQTPEGYIITEFHPDVPWAGKYNGISCPAMLHFCEGRWLRDQQYLRDYAFYWLRGGGTPRSYSFPLAWALYQNFLVTGNDSIMIELYPDLCANFKAWEDEKFIPESGLFWQIDGCDGMEVSIGGSGYRVTINSYLTAEAFTLALIGKRIGDADADQWCRKAERLHQNMLGTLWDPEAHFFKVLSRDSEATLCSARELHGYTPWAFDLASEKYADAWKFLHNTKHFKAPYGPTTAEQCHPEFKVAYEGHECQWNGPSWPLSTSITLMGLANILNNQQQSVIGKEEYLDLLQTYSNSQRRTLENGRIVPWIDENINPFTGEWLARELLIRYGNKIPERGKDYNHSSFCDLVISGLVGIRPQEGTVVINPLLPSNKWDYFAIDNVYYQGHQLSVVYDRTGKKYGLGIGLMLFVDNKKVASRPDLGMVDFVF